MTGKFILVTEPPTYEVLRKYHSNLTTAQFKVKYLAAHREWRRGALQVLLIHSASDDLYELRNVLHDMLQLTLTDIK